MSRQIRIQEQLQCKISPAYLNVEDESHHHHVPKGAQTHFKVIAVSTQFSGLSRVARHRLINHCLDNEFKSGLHALSMHLYTPEEWETKKITLLKSPTCKDGYNK